MRAEEAGAAGDRARWHGAMLASQSPLPLRGVIRGTTVSHRSAAMRAEDQPDQGGDDDRVAPAARGDLVRGGVGEDLRRLDVLRQQEELGSSSSCRAGRRADSSARISLSVSETLELAIASWILLMSALSMATCASRFLILFVGIGAELLHDLVGETVRRAGRDLPLLRLHADLDERVDVAVALFDGGAGCNRLRRDPFLELRRIRVTEVRDRVVDGLVVDDLPDGGRIRLRSSAPARRRSACTAGRDRSSRWRSRPGSRRARRGSR